MANGTTARRAFLLAAAVVAGLAASSARAEDSPAVPPGAAKPPANAAETTALPADKSAVTHHTITVDGRALAYQATAGVLPVPAAGKVPEARIFYVSYMLDGADAANRPITFAFNGGPGAASAYLHLGALGPRRLVLNDDGTVPAPPARFADNPLTWLAFTDLVFIDPVGTGFSRSVERKDERKGDPKGGRPDGKGEEDSEKAFFGTRPDNETLGRFIQLYLGRSNRWLSPKFLIGESYGGFRVAALAELLQSNFSIGLSGAVLVSPVLDFGLIWGGGHDPLPWALKLPTLAAIALFHGKSSLPATSGPVTRAALAEVEAWSLGGYLSELARGDALPDAEAQAMVDKVAAYSGLPKELVARRHGHITNGAFAKALLQGSGRYLNFYDGSVTQVDVAPEVPERVEGDHILSEINAALLSAFEGYLRGELNFETDLPYRVLNASVSRQWRWLKDATAQGFLGAVDALKAGASINPHLKVMIAHGLFDMVTPYYTSVYAVSQMYLDKTVRGNVTLKTYAGGHMLYTHEAARAAFFRDAEAFYRDATAPAAR